MPAQDKVEIEVVIDGTKFTAPLRDFKEGTKKGYGVYGIVKINDYPYKITCSIIKI